MTQQFYIGKTQDHYVNIHWNPRTDNSLLIRGSYHKARDFSVFLWKQAILEERKAQSENVTSPHIAINSRDQMGADSRLQAIFETRLHFIRSEGLEDISNQVKPVYVFFQDKVGKGDQEIMERLVYGKALNIHHICFLEDGAYYDPVYNLITAQVHVKEDDTFSFRSVFTHVKDGILVEKEKEKEQENEE